MYENINSFVAHKITRKRLEHHQATIPRLQILMNSVWLENITAWDMVSSHKEQFLSLILSKQLKVWRKFSWALQTRLSVGINH